MTDLCTRQYQEDAVDSIIKYLQHNPGKNPVVCAATGTGKSVIIARLICRILTANKSVRICVSTHVAELLSQNAEKLAMMMPLVDMGFYSAALNKRDTHNQVIFAGIQTAYRVKAHDIGKINILIIDEVHTLSRKDKSMWQKFIATLKENNPNLVIIGFSATPFRMDSGSLTSGDDAMFDDMIYDYGLGRAIQDGYLCPLTSKYTETEFDISRVGKVAGEFNMKELEAATNVDHLTQKAVDEMIRKASDRRSWLIFCNGIAHSFSVRDELRRRGIVAETVTGETPDQERARILQEFKAGNVRAVTNNAVWTTGVDVPGVDMIGMLRHTMSKGLLVQMAGRGTRTVIDLSPYKTARDRREAIAASTKPNCLFLDFAGNIERHGFIDTIGPQEKKKGEGVAPMKACDQCFTICHAAAKKCPDCGYEFPMNEKQNVTELYKGRVLSGDDLREVIDVQYFPHNMNKDGKTPCLMVKYLHPDGTDTREYICLWHTGFAQEKAARWWNDRMTLEGDSEVPDPYTLIDDGYCRYLKTPASIVVKKDGKYDRITKYNGMELRTRNNQNQAESALSAEDEAFDIPW